MLTLLRRIEGVSNKTIKGMVKELRMKRKTPMRFTTFVVGGTRYTLGMCCKDFVDLYAGNPQQRLNMKMILGIPASR